MAPRVGPAVLTGTESRGHHKALTGGSWHVIVPSHHPLASLVTAPALPRTFWGVGASAGQKEPPPAQAAPCPQGTDSSETACVEATQPHLPVTGLPRPGPRAAEGPGAWHGQGSLLL